MISILDINHDYISKLREAYGDGVTIEVHTYPKNLTKEDVRSRVRQSTVTVFPESYDPERVTVHRTSYLDEE